MWPFKPASPPPVPQKLREMLKEYPELIERLQESLNKVITDPVKSEPPFEVAIWRLEGTLSSFLAEARKELEVAKAIGDPEAIERADQKERLMSIVMLRGTHNLSELQAYFEASGGY
jgi:hypothetical protein